MSLNLFALVGLTSLHLLSCFMPEAVADAREDLRFSLGNLRDAYLSRYALYPVKKALFGWDAQAEYERVLRKGLANPNLDRETAQKLVFEYVEATRDYHGRAILAVGERARLGFTTRTAAGRVFVTRITTPSLPLKAGDEILEFDREPAIRGVLRLMTRFPNHPQTDLHDANRRLTDRYGILGEPMPMSSAAEVKFRRGTSVQTLSVDWVVQKALASEATRPVRRSPIPELLQGNSGSAGAMEPPGVSVPRPDTMIWEPSPAPKYFKAWIGLQGARRIGMIRIPTFDLPTSADYTAATTEFESLIRVMNDSSDALILDIQGNRGGMLDYAWALASFFYSRPQPAFKFQYRLFPALVESARRKIPELEAIRTIDQAYAYFGGPDYFGFPVTLDFVRDVIAFYRGIVSDAATGAKLGQPRYYNSSVVPAHPRTRYLKPVVLAVDDYTASCGDTLAAFFQDTRRGFLVGSLTAGAGAFTGSAVNVENRLGFASFIIPLALEYRYGGRIVENVGVRPEYPLSPNAGDFFGAEYRRYRTEFYRYVLTATQSN